MTFVWLTTKKLTRICQTFSPHVFRTQFSEVIKVLPLIQQLSYSQNRDQVNASASQTQMRNVSRSRGKFPDLLLPSEKKKPDPVVQKI